MPQIILKGVTPEQCSQAAPLLSKQVSEAIQVPAEHIVVEYNAVNFYRMGQLDQNSTMAEVLWKKRPQELQQKVAKIIADILKSTGCKTVEVIYQNLDMNDFYEFL